MTIHNVKNISRGNIKLGTEERNKIERKPS